MARVSMREAFRRTKARERKLRAALTVINVVEDATDSREIARAALDWLPAEVDDRLERVQAAIYQQLLHEPLAVYRPEFDLEGYSAGVADRVLAALDGVDQR